MVTIPTIDPCRRRPPPARLDGSWQDSWKPSEQDALGRSGRFIGSAFPYDAVRNVFLCPAGKELTLQIITNEENGVRRHVYKAPKAACRTCALRDQCGPKNKRPEWRRAVTRNEEPPASIAFKAKMETEEAKQIYRQRSQVAEFPHAWIKERCGLRQFRCGDKRRHRWKLPGLASVTTSSVG